jgi:hypothetical protein
MTSQTPRELLEKGLITDDQFKKIQPIVSGNIISVYYELRTLLYLGILLFTTGSGILIYQNIGQIGHLVSVFILFIFTAVCFWYIFKNAPPFTNEEATSPTPYFDYIVLLGALLFISVLGYLQFLYDIFEAQPGLITLVTSLFFFYIAYRFDHAGILSLAITALASFWSISLSPQKWYRGEFLNLPTLYVTAIIFSVALGTVAFMLDRKSVKPHFTFTYLNFCTLIFFAGSMAGMFDDEWYGIYLLLIYAGCAFAFYMARWKRSFLFLLYAFISAYIGTTYLLARTVLSEAIELWFFYSIASCGGFVYFLIRFKNYFKKQS